MGGSRGWGSCRSYSTTQLLELLWVELIERHAHRYAATNAHVDLDLLSHQGLPSLLLLVLEDLLLSKRGHGGGIMN